MSTTNWLPLRDQNETKMADLNNQHSFKVDFLHFKGKENKSLPLAAVLFIE